VIVPDLIVILADGINLIPHLMVLAESHLAPVVEED
jgi:hypothetical protein